MRTGSENSEAFGFVGASSKSPLPTDAGVLLVARKTPNALPLPSDGRGLG